ncbi:hypothetical protein [Flavobacterium sp. LC2016-01]|uniref:hypothetical protein n=1 Tax=Flavobacterium sp. LC2016-01 TaxID=2675876 RepID=UPI0012BAE939|nr:hypothetical protein [Flavobacterium sp. LC2016-01]MTH14503.1 hypothetical protein [Flavobacterium sp. LC2016-01]
MKKLILPIIAISFAFTVQSCLKKETISPKKNVSVIDSLPEHDCAEEEEYEETVSGEPNDVTYPETGNKIADFLPKPDVYEVQYKAEGDLNNDNLPDIAVVLKHKENYTLKRPMLILLQNIDKSYHLDKISNIVIPAEYDENDFKMYSEKISIEKGELRIYLFGGPHNAISSTFKYIEKGLVLNTLTAYSGGAGSIVEMSYDFEKSEITTKETNTMEENMPSTSETFPVKKEFHFFEDTAITEFYNEDSDES